MDFFIEFFERNTQHFSWALISWFHFPLFRMILNPSSYSFFLYWYPSSNPASSSPSSHGSWISFRFCLLLPSIQFQSSFCSIITSSTSKCNKNVFMSISSAFSLLSSSNFLEKWKKWRGRRIMMMMMMGKQKCVISQWNPCSHRYLTLTSKLFYFMLVRNQEKKVRQEGRTCDRSTQEELGVFTLLFTTTVCTDNVSLVFL